jgi:hypothetical protein
MRSVPYAEGNVLLLRPRSHYGFTRSESPSRVAQHELLALTGYHSDDVDLHTCASRYQPCDDAGTRDGRSDIPLH